MDMNSGKLYLSIIVAILSYFWIVVRVFSALEPSDCFRLSLFPCPFPFRGIPSSISNVVLNFPRLISRSCFSQINNKYFIGRHRLLCSEFYLQSLFFLFSCFFLCIFEPLKRRD